MMFTHHHRTYLGPEDREQMDYADLATHAARLLREPLPGDEGDAWDRCEDEAVIADALAAQAELRAALDAANEAAATLPESADVDAPDPFGDLWEAVLRLQDAINAPRECGVEG